MNDLMIERILTVVHREGGIIPCSEEDTCFTDLRDVVKLLCERFSWASGLQYLYFITQQSGLTDDRLAQALSNVPQQSIVLLEDVDAAFHHRNPGEYNRSHVTFSGS